MNNYGFYRGPEEERPEQDGARPGVEAPQRSWTQPSGQAMPPPPPPQPAYRGQGPYQRTSYGSGYEGGTYDNRNTPQQPVTTYRQAGGAYQYSTTGGWQVGRPDGYEWNYGELDRTYPRPRKKRRRGGIVLAMTLLCILSAGLLVVAGYNIVRVFNPGEAIVGEENPGASESVAETQESPASPVSEVTINIALKPPSAEEEDPQIGERMTIPQVARAVRPSVVGILNYQYTSGIEPTTEGSGIIISDSGYIVTNAHVVEAAESLVVVFGDNEELEATIIGADMRTDLAVIRVQRDGLVPATLGDSGELEVGETVIAIGNPGGLELAGSVTQGIISAINRVMKTPYVSTNYIQTDAAINPGNSGGALCNEYGQVVGINSAKIVAEGYEGISFAIPITEALPIIEDLIQNGRVTGRVILGITGDVVSEITARNKDVPAGVQITSITSEELKEKGVQRMDIITHVDEERILDMADLYDILQSHRAGDVITLTLYRPSRDNTFEVSVTLMEDTGSN